MHPAVTSSTRFLRRKTFALLAASAAVAGAAALLTARGDRRVTVGGACDAEAVQRAGGMQLAVRARACSILRGATETHVAVEITAPDVEARGREPVALSLIVDRSGSMVGEPLADAKAAALRALDALGADDAFSLVTYSTGADVDVPLGLATTEHKARARAVIERMRADGGTNISAGLLAAASTLETTCAGCPRDRLERIVLISDGDPNEGVWDREGLARLAAVTAEGGASISTIGVGLDFNERIMTDMAVAGRGNYYFVERTADLASIFDQELGSLGATVAVDARVRLTPAAGVEVAEAYGYRLERAGAGPDGAAASGAPGASSSIDHVGADVIVPIADLRAGETRKVVLRVRVQSDALGTRELVAARLQWRPVGEHQERALDARVAVAVTDDAARAERSVIAAAERQVQEARMAHAIDQATEAYEQGDAVRAQAIIHAQAAEGAAAAASIGDDTLKQRLGGARLEAEKNFKPGAPKKKGAKANRAMSYDLAR